MATQPVEFPEFYDFPPFFTIQPNDATRAQQLALWSSFICSYTKAKRQFFLDVSEEARNSELFHNNKIKRKLTIGALRTILEHLVAQGLGRWANSEKSRMTVFWKTAAEWGAEIYSWVVAEGRLNSVETVFALREGDDTQATEFHGVPYEVMIAALETLESSGKAKIFKGTTSDQDGVKFLSQAR
uniref:Vacuolar protein-sorting-associated protein 25 n=1 Tax=Chromera velia CCMP2878 TaxID=1169474 RepID=A0A0G4H8T3_9ALVE|mmetsp:Transcript_48163/g.95058  ORF Transcript_48163/g.95058 Transcript_48163/m.95058 type:complete len:185 (-) Transcript_48163:259-813(-)|eukprot:Cvel_25124.t1-p1 / transcript=Cvel_25124.t1 / gene=Cvel_25124 / organism=Chromera_velia_CCMP2878 / gene_product=Vacuolar protein-sorting-associated protein 25, putative / transcript_product=Vacuolar protein-sorting-associated protein 25, putative / location=Cvel_scaffold2805:16127-19530(+) / protein_length=184 / sequence_SO=supercontig / SO=protein_coding / is_pseudo=false